MMTEFGKGSGSSIWGKENFCYSHQIIKAAASVVKWIKCLKYDATVIRYIHMLWYKFIFFNQLLFLSKTKTLCDEIIYYQKQFLNIVAILSFDLFGFIKPTTYQDHLQIRYKMGFWCTCHVTPQTFAVTSYIFPHC